MNKLLAFLALAATPAALVAAPTTYDIDPVHSSVNFTVRHFVSKVRGHFGEFSGKLTFDPANLKAASAEGVIKIKSVDTANTKRDGHLQSADFFNAEKFPDMTFKSTSWTAGDAPNTYVVVGDLTFSGVTKPVTLKLVHTGTVDNPMTKGKVAGFEATGVVKRSDWGMKYGEGMIGDDVAVEILIEAAVAAPEAK